MARGDRWVDPALALALAGLTLWQLLLAIRVEPFHRDEARWVYRVHLLREWGDPFGPRWENGGYDPGAGTGEERLRMTDQPPLGGYVLALGLLLQGRDLETNGFWNMEESDAWNAASGNRPAPADLEAARRTIAAVGALAVAATFFLGKRLGGRLAGAAAGLLLAVHPLWLDTASRAWTDPLLLLLVALAGVAAGRLAERPTWGRALVLGAVLGLGGATKLTPLAVAAGLGGIGVGLLVWRVVRSAKPWYGWGVVPASPGVGTPRYGLDRRSPSGAERDGQPGAGWRTRLSDAIGGLRTDQLGWKLVAVPVVAGAVFVGSYPHLWPDPVGRTRAMVDFRTETMAGQARLWPGLAVETRATAFRRLGSRLGVRNSASGWAAEAASRRLGFGGSVPGAVRDLDLLLAIVGAQVLAFRLTRDGPRAGAWLAAAAVLAQAAITVLGLRVNFQRYHLPVLLAVALLAGLALDAGWSGVRQAVARWAPARPAGRGVAEAESEPGHEPGHEPGWSGAPG